MVPTPPQDPDMPANGLERCAWPVEASSVAAIAAPAKVRTRRPVEGRVIRLPPDREEPVVSRSFRSNAVLGAGKTGGRGEIHITPKYSRATTGPQPPDGAFQHLMPGRS